MKVRPAWMGGYVAGIATTALIAAFLGLVAYINWPVCGFRKEMALALAADAALVLRNRTS